MSEPGEVGGTDRRPARSSGLTLVALLGGAVLAAVLLGQLTAPDPPPRPATAISPTTTSNTLQTPELDRSIDGDASRCPVVMGALALGDPLRVRAKAIEHWDCPALAQGPWAMVIRAPDGHFGVRGAVVTFPSPWGPEPSDTRLAKPPGARWNAELHRLAWPLADSNAHIVGDLGQATLADLAAHVTVENGRPRLSPRNGFTAADTTTSTPWVIHEMLYDTVDLGQVSTLGNGQVWTGVLRGGSLEGWAFDSYAKPAGFVRGKQAFFYPYPVYEALLGDQDAGSLVWESAPGELAYISFAGSSSEARAINALRALADKGTVLTATQWWNLDRAQGGPPGSLQGEVQGAP